jgi:hypothetical protein
MESFPLLLFHYSGNPKVSKIGGYRHTGGFLGHDRCQGQMPGLRARRQEALILMGGWCGAYTADTTRKKTGMRLRLPVGGGVGQAERNRKKLPKVV